MKLALGSGPADAALAGTYRRFEEEFSYPLGVGERFSIEHGGDAWTFFRAMGEAVHVVASDGDLVLGALGAALRRVDLPAGGSAPMLYLGDLKIAARARGGRVLLLLARVIQAHFASRAEAAFAVVMDGTATTPTAYTGRLGIPAFAPVDTCAILWLRTGAPAATSLAEVATEAALACFDRLGAGHHRLPHGDPALRSLLAPRWLVDPDGQACARLEDTLRAKRLRASSGEDMRSAHLSCFAYRRPVEGARLVRTALGEAARAGYPLLFVAVPRDEAPVWTALLGDHLRSLAPATVFAAGASRPGRWLINTAEI